MFSNNYIAPLVVEVRSDNLAELDAQAKAVAEVARSVPGIVDVRVSLETLYPEVRVETNREEAGLVGVSARSAAQTTLEATLGNINTPSVWIDPNNGQSYYVVTYYDATQVRDPEGLAQIPVRLDAAGGSVPLGAYAKIRRSVGPIAIERNQLQPGTERAGDLAPPVPVRLTHPVLDGDDGIALGKIGKIGGELGGREAALF